MKPATSLKKEYNLLAVLFLFISLSVSILVIVGWIYDIEIFKSVFPHFVAMNPATAACFLFICFALGNLYLKNLLNQSTFSRKDWWGYFLLSVVLLTGIFKLLDYSIDIDLKIDQLLFSNKLNFEPNSVPNRMAPNTAFNFTVLSLGILLIYFNKPKTFLTGQLLVLLTMTISLVAVIGYLYSITNLYQIQMHIPMALHTAFLFLIISLTVFCLNPEKGLIKTITSKQMGSNMAKSLLPMAIFLPLLMGFLFIESQRKNVFNTEVGMSILIVSFILLFSLLIWLTANSLNRTDLNLREAEDRIKELKNMELAKINNEIDRFVYSASHDLRAPLTTVMGLINVAKLDEKNKKADYLPMIEERINRLDHIIRNIIDYSKNSRIEILNERVQIQEAFNEALGFLKAKDAEGYSAVKIISDIQENGNFWSDRERIILILKNLISNSIEYRKLNGATSFIKVEIKFPENNMSITIEDNGIGIPTEIQDRIFDMHVRGTQRSKGAGLGLYLVKEAVSKLGGQIHMYSIPEELTVFTIEIPNRVNLLNRTPLLKI